MSDRYIGVGLVVVFLTLIAVVLGVGRLGMQTMDSLRADAQKIADEPWVDVQLASEALDLSNQNSQINMQIVLSDSPSGTDSLLARRQENSARISNLLGRLETRVGSAHEGDCLNAVLETRKLYQASYQHATALVLAGKKAEARRFLTQETLPRLLTYHSAFSAFATFQTIEMNQELDKSSTKYRRTREEAASLIALAILLAAGIAAFVVPKIMFEIRRREKAENNLRGLNQELELKVLQRTAALERSNLDLSSEIAERKRSEALVRRLSTAVEQCPVSVVITDPSGCITYVNQKFLECTGYTYEEAFGQNPRILKSGRTTAEEYQRMWGCITAGNEWRGEFCNRRKNGELYWEYAVIRPIRDEKGNITHFLAIKEDITERRSMQTQLQQAQKLEAIGQLAAGIAHEINTPMQFIGDNTRFVQQAWASLDELIAPLCAAPGSRAGEGSLRQLVERLETADLPYLRKEVPSAIEQSLDGVARVTKIVRAMKEFSHPGSEEKQLANINQAIETTLTVARSEWKHVADLETSLSDQVGMVPCHIGEFNQVILNLLVNAAHAIAVVVGDGSNAKGKITIRTTREQNWARISIQDTGCGIPPAIQAHIFDPFFTTKEPGKGTGQGLALAHAVIVKKHGGSIWFDSKLGVGTTFFFRLPLQPAAGENDSNRAAMAAQPVG